MGFITSIIYWLDDIADFSYSAYLEVQGWIFPFSYLATPFYYIYRGFFWLSYYFAQFDKWLLFANQLLSEIPTIWTFWSYFKPWLEAGLDAWDWVVNSLENIWNIINDWWAATSLTVQAWIDTAKNDLLFWINWLSGQVLELREDIDNLLSQIPNVTELTAWFRNWTGNVLAVVNTWWASSLLDINGLFRSWTLELEPFWAGWQDIRAQVFDFFDDPLEWLLNRFTDWFLGPEV